MLDDAQVARWYTLSGQIGDRLRAARTELGLSQRQLAARVGSSQTVIQKIENGFSQRPRIAVELALAVGVSPVWLVFGVEAPAEERRALRRAA